MKCMNNTLVGLAALMASALAGIAAGSVQTEILSSAKSEEAFVYIFDVELPASAKIHECVLTQEQVSRQSIKEIRGCYITIEPKDFQSLFKAWPSIHCVPSSAIDIGMAVPMVGPAFEVTEACYMTGPRLDINESVVFTNSTQTKLRAYHRVLVME